MTRKRFIRLVMAEGIQRNNANDLADRLILICGSWDNAYTRFRMVKGHLPDLSIKFDDFALFAAETLVEAVNNLGKAFREAALKIRPITLWTRKEKGDADDDPGD